MGFYGFLLLLSYCHSINCDNCHLFALCFSLRLLSSLIPSFADPFLLSKDISSPKYACLSKLNKSDPTYRGSKRYSSSDARSGTGSLHGSCRYQTRRGARGMAKNGTAWARCHRSSGRCRSAHPSLTLE